MATEGFGLRVTRKARRLGVARPFFLCLAAAIIGATGADAITQTRSSLSVTYGDSSVEIRGYERFFSPLGEYAASRLIADGSGGLVKGTGLSLWYEWACHSAAALFMGTEGSLGGLTVGASVFSDAGHGLAGFAMKASYLVMAFPVSLYDLSVSGGWKADWPRPDSRVAETGLSI